MGLSDKEAALPYRQGRSHNQFPLAVVEHYRVRTWYLDRDGATREHVGKELAQATYPKDFGAGDLIIKDGMFAAQGTIIPRHRILAIEWERMTEEEARNANL